MNSQFPEDLQARIRSAGVVAVIVIDDPQHAVAAAQALLDGGIDAIELTLRTPAALEAAKLIRQQVPAMLLGLGTVLTTDQVDAAVDVQVSFAVSPGLNPRVVKHAQECGLPFAPGIVTPSDIEAAVELGCRELKFFPAEPSGGMDYLKSIAAPYKHLGLQFIPLGGLHSRNMGSYLRSDLVMAIGGSWIASRQTISKQDWPEITRSAAEAVRLVKGIRSEQEA